MILLLCGDSEGNDKDGHQNWNFLETGLEFGIWDQIKNVSYGFFKSVLDFRLVNYPPKWLEVQF